MENSELVLDEGCQVSKGNFGVHFLFQNNMSRHDRLVCRETPYMEVVHLFHKIELNNKD